MVLAALGLAVAAVLTGVLPVGGAVPASARVGRVTYTDIKGTTDLTTYLRSFTIQSTMAATPGSGSVGGSSGKAAFGSPLVIQDVVAGSPDILAALAAGRRLERVTVTLFHPETTKRFQAWVFEDAVFTLDDQTQKGPATNAPRETVSWAYQRVTQTTYEANGTTVTGTSCFDVAAGAACAP